jgi:hypothetical protein
MKTKIFILSLFIVLVSSVFSQNNTFYKTLPSTGKDISNILTQVIQDNDGGYILNCDGYLKYIKTNQFGYLEWTKEYPEIINPGYEIRRTFDDGFIAIGSKIIGGVSDVCLVKLNENLDTVWTKIYGDLTKDERGESVIQLADSSYLFSFYRSEDTTTVINKVDKNGLLVISKSFTSGNYLIRSYLQNIDNNNFLLWKPFELKRMDDSLTVTWSIPTAKSSFCKITSDSMIITMSGSSLIKLKLNGDIIWEKPFERSISMIEFSDASYLFVTGNLLSGGPSKLINADTSGTILSQLQLDFHYNNLIVTQDNGIALCGYSYFQREYLTQNNYFPSILKMDNNLDYNAVNLLQPFDNSQLVLFSEYPIVWKLNNVNYINIDYSVDNQTTWNSVIHYYPAEADTFLWTIPNLPIGDIYLRISNSFNQDIYDRSDPPQRTGYISVDYLTANEIKLKLNNNAIPTPLPYNFWTPMYWPSGENATITSIESDGLVWGGIVNGETRVNGTTYECGIIPGYINENGNPSDPFDIKSKIYKLKKNWQSMPPGLERNRYEFDYLNWPVDIGAPWTDNNGDGIYTLGIDEPKILGEQTLFYVTNDLDTAGSLNTYGSNPIGLEFQLTTFGYNTELLKDAVFKKYDVINKSNNEISNMYFTYWTYCELGNFSDDFVGCDTLLNLGFTYNGDNDDEGYYGTPPPAVGHLIVQPPIISGEPTDSARYGDGWKKGYKNLQISSFVIYLKSNYGPYKEPAGKMYDTVLYEGTLEFYNNMQGLTWDGNNFIDPNTNLPTHFCLAGDPETGTGWYEGAGWPQGPQPYMRWYSISTGPFNMAPGDTQQIVVTYLIKKGTDNINSVAVLKDYAAQIQHWYDNDLVTDVKETIPAIPTEFSLSQNYPNPFNPVTTIRYTIPTTPQSPPSKGGEAKQGWLIMLKVYDILGSEVATLLNNEQSAGSYEVNFDASKLASGIYFYRLVTGSFTETKKMILIK